MPSGNLLRALLLTLNEFSVTCHGDSLASYPGDITVYGGPILYLILQALLLFAILTWYESGWKPSCLGKRSGRSRDVESKTAHLPPDVAAEISQVESSTSGLRAQHLTKSFGGVLAVDDVTFTIRPSTVFALLGPNGAGKSTTISLIRGDLRTDHHGGDILVEGKSVDRHKAEARRHLGVCPQFDAMDTMTVLEHLQFYARARGVPDVHRNVECVIDAVGLNMYRHRLAQNLSGGNKRKLSLAIALVGNPSALLLDEPSSGMDAAAKRVMWRTLQAVSAGRAILITTHSMEEADKLADRAGIMATRMLAIDTVEGLRGRFGSTWYVHIVLAGAPHVSDQVCQQAQAWVQQNIPGAIIERQAWGGQLRFTVEPGHDGRHEMTVAQLFRVLEENKASVGFDYYSISQATLDQVFLTIVGQHNVREEGHADEKPKKRRIFRRSG